MGLSRSKSSDTPVSTSRTRNKQRRQSWHIEQKKAKDSAKRELRFRRRREEQKNPHLREERRAQNVPVTIERKRVWDEVEGDEERLGLSVDLDALKRKRRKAHEDEKDEETPFTSDSPNSGYSDVDSMLEDDGSEGGEDMSAHDRKQAQDTQPKSTSNVEKRIYESEIRRTRSPSPATLLRSMASSLSEKYPTLFTPPQEPKVLITTSINSTLHNEARLLTHLFPNSHYIRRTAHYAAHKYSVREISKFAANRDFTSVMVLEENQKRPTGLTIVHLPTGPTFHFSLNSWLPGSVLPGHGNPTGHYPELMLNNFRTPLGILTAHLFRTLFPTRPELIGRQVVTLHNQRDYIFFRRHRYQFRDKRETEKSIIGTDGKPMKGVEEIRAGLQEIGPRFTLKLRRIDTGIQRASGQEWEWKGAMEKARTRFQL